MPIRVLLSDDEALARERLRSLLEEEPDIEIVAECGDGKSAVATIKREKPDLVFLDIQMPGMTGFDVLDRLDDVPQVIFATAYDEYAIKAFEVSALDYLLKPIDPVRLAAALQKVRPRVAPPRLEQVFVRDGERCWIVRVADVYLLESEGNYTRLYFGKERPLIPRSLVVIEERLDPAVFFRAGRKHIVNLKWIERVETGVAGNLVVTLRSGQSVEMSRRQSVRLREVLSL